MADELTHLLQGHRSATLSAEALELMGKQAANLLLDEEISLNESIAKLAAAHPEINQEQVKRICEFANTAVYLSQHDKNKTASAKSSYPQFELADPNRIIQDLSDGARPTDLTRTDIDYGRQPMKNKVSAAEADRALEDLFGFTSEKRKEASAHHSPATGVEEIMGCKADLESRLDSLRYTVERLDMLRKEASAAYFNTVKQHLLDKGSFADVVIAARASGMDDEKMAQELEPVVMQVIKEKISTARRMQDSVKTLEKVAHRVVNESHPLVVRFATLMHLDAEIEKVASEIEEVSTQRSRVDAFIKENFRASKAG